MRTLLDYLLSPAVRKNPALRRAHLELMTSLAAPFLFMPIAAVATLFLKDQFDSFDAIWFGAWFLLPIVQFLLLRLTGKVQMVRDILSLSLLGFVGIGAAYSGGVESSMVIGLCVIPLENMVSGDRRRVMLAIASVLLCIFLLWVLGDAGLLPADRTSEALRDSLRPLAILFVMLYCFLVADALIRNRRESEQALLKTENQFESLFETAPISIIEQDWSRTRRMIDQLMAGGVEDLNRHLADNPDILRELAGSMRIVRMNQATLALYRAKNAHELADHMATARLSEEELRNLRHWLVAFTKGNAGGYLNETIGRRLQGGQVYMRIRSAIVPEHRHDWLRVITTVGDVSDRKRVELALHAAKEEADNANRAKSRFLASMSHELRTPLNAIIGFSEIMAKQMFGPIGEPRYIAYAEDVHNSGQHLLSLINDMLDLSRIESGKYELFEENLNAGNLFDWVLNMTEPQITACGVHVDLDVQEDLPDFRADHRAMRQVLLNLFSNALKFTPAGKSVILRALQDAATGEIVFQVADTGRGIPADMLATITQPFVQAGDNYTRRETGTGLGLSITKSLVELHGGSLHLISTEHVGTVVSVRLPADRGAEGCDAERLRV